MSHRHTLHWGSPSPTPDGMLADYVIRRECGTAPGNMRHIKVSSAGQRLTSEPSQPQVDTHSISESANAQPPDNHILSAQRVGADWAQTGSRRSSRGLELDQSSGSTPRPEVHRQDSLVVKGLINSGAIEGRLERSREYTRIDKVVQRRSFDPTGGATLGMDQRPPSRQVR